MLQHHAERHAGFAGSLDQRGCALGCDLKWLLQQDMLAGRGAFAHEVEMRVRRREDLNAVDRFVSEDRLKVARERQREFPHECLAPCCARTERVSNLHPVFQIDQALGVRRYRHAKPDDGDAVLRHYCSARIAPHSSARPLSRPMPVYPGLIRVFSMSSSMRWP